MYFTSSICNTIPERASLRREGVQIIDNHPTQPIMQETSGIYRVNWLSWRRRGFNAAHRHLDVSGYLVVGWRIPTTCRKVRCSSCRRLTTRSIATVWGAFRKKVFRLSCVHYTHYLMIGVVSYMYGSAGPCPGLFGLVASNQSSIGTFDVRGRIWSEVGWKAASCSLVVVNIRGSVRGVGMVW